MKSVRKKIYVNLKNRFRKMSYVVDSHILYKTDDEIYFAIADKMPLDDLLDEQLYEETLVNDFRQ